MADIKDFKHAIVRQKILDAVRKDLIGPTSDCEQLNEVPTSSYITGLLYPADTDVTEDENYNDVEFTEKNFDADGETLEAGIFEEEEPEDRVKGGFQKPSSIGVSFYVSDDVQKVNAYINWGRRVMSGAMQKEKFAGLCCSGNHPHRPGAEAKICKKSVIPSQRGASNVYFTVTRNAISIPPWTNPINDIMGAQRATIETLVEAMGEEAGLSFAYQKYFGDKYSYEDFIAAYDRLSQNIKEFTELKEMEYAAITHHEDVEYQHDVKYFKAEEVTLSESLKEYISRIIKIHRLREVRVLTGFTRLEAPEPEVDEQSHIVKLKCSSGEKWLPAVEINGEGVFIELNKEKINQWMQIETVKSRSDKYEECYAAYCQKKGWENFKPRNAEYVLLHTLSHMLIKEMSMQSGYSSSALHERIYSSENMCGILIYTGAADKEGSLGGLVELGGMNKFLPLLKGALENGLTCTTDPECFMKNPTSERLNGAACHSCTMISETACENGNRLLDRALVVPVPEHEKMGYFRELVRDLCGIQV